jgi:ribosome-binding factor A
MNQTSLIKKKQKESLLFRELSTIITLLQQDEKKIIGLVPTRVSLSDDKGHCTLYFICETEDEFLSKLETLKLYKPSIRAQLSKNIIGRYTPELVFKYDQQFKKQLEIDQILDSIATKLPQADDN